jgi:hypothetical protein
MTGDDTRFYRFELSGTAASRSQKTAEPQQSKALGKRLAFPSRIREPDTTAVCASQPFLRSLAVFA